MFNQSPNVHTSWCMILSMTTQYTLVDDDAVQSSRHDINYHYNVLQVIVVCAPLLDMRSSHFLSSSRSSRLLISAMV